MLQNVTRAQFQAHPYHLVTPSPWPLLTSFSLLILTVAAAMYFNGYANGGMLVSIGFITVVASMALWFRDVIAEGALLGNHTFAVQKGLNLGVALFIVSEVFFFHFNFLSLLPFSLSAYSRVRQCMAACWGPSIRPLRSATTKHSNFARVRR